MNNPPGSVVFLLLVLAPPSIGQGINIDFLNTSGPYGPCGSEFAPSGTYGAATTFTSTQTGYWNAVYPFWSIPTSLTNVAGEMTGIDIEFMCGNFLSGLCFDHPQTQGEDQILLDDCARFFFSVWQVHGLRPGDYRVYAYGWDPLGVAHTSVNVGIAGAPLGPAMQSGGDWPGAQVENVTYTLHAVTIGAGDSLEIHAEGIPIPGMVGYEGRINGLQIVPDAIGTVYCSDASSAMGQSALLSATGSVSIAANDLTIEASFLPPGALVQLLFGSGSTAAVLPGVSHCIAHFAPFPAAYADTAGTIFTAIDFTQPPLALAPLVAGTSWKFQARFRDNQWRRRGVLRGVLHSDALEIRFTP